MSSIDFLSWPAVPEKQRPKRLYHAGVEPQEFEALISAGWAPEDVRLMASETDEEKASAIKAWLEGVRLGSIEPGKGIMRFVELEARIFGLMEAKGRGAPKDTTLADEDVDELMNIGGRERVAAQQDPNGKQATKPKSKRRGRPKASKNDDSARAV
jgi:hypothetical protein